MTWILKILRGRNISVVAAILFGSSALVLAVNWWLQQTFIPFNRFILLIATGILVVNGGLMMTTVRKDALIAEILASAAIVSQLAVLILLLMSARTVLLL